MLGALEVTSLMIRVRNNKGEYERVTNYTSLPVGVELISWFAPIQKKTSSSRRLSDH